MAQHDTTPADPAGRVAVVTGASRGIGAGIAEAWRKRGVRLGLCSRSAPALPEGPDVVAAELDVTDADALEAFVVRVEERLGPIDCWINNAGVLDPIAPLRLVGSADFRRHVDVNLCGVFLGTRAFVRHLRRRGGSAAGREGVLLNISSGAAQSAYAGWSAYCAAKAGVDRLTECVQLEEASSGLRAHAVAPGVVDTDMQDRILRAPEEHFPALPRFVELREKDGYNSVSFVAERLLALAFDPAERPDEVVVRLPFGD